MSKNKSKGLFTLITGMAMGAAAIFFSKKDNRVKAKKTVDKGMKAANKLRQELEENPDFVKKKIKKEAKEIGKKISKEIKSQTNKKKSKETKSQNKGKKLSSKKTKEA
ncbi:MAG: hypothetical protein PVJ09_01800 [Candidatus Woesebacteria bacterium]|jgi:hypothetical protein